MTDALYGRIGGKSVRYIGAIGLACQLLACVGDKGVAPALRTADGTLGTMTVSPVNAVMAVGDTLSVAAVGQTLTGAPITHFDSVEYILQNPSDSLRVRVSSSGVVTARAVSDPYSPVLLQVIAFKDGLARADLAVITVVATAFSGATLSVQPAFPAADTLEVDQQVTVTPWIGNTVSGIQLTDPQIRLETDLGRDTIIMGFIPSFVSTPTLTAAQLNAGVKVLGGAPRVLPGLDQIFGTGKGTAWVHARVTVFGVPLHDSVACTVTNSFFGYAFVQAGNFGLATPMNAIIAPGGTVLFGNSLLSSLGASIRIAFDNPAAATVATPPSTSGDTVGNITLLMSGQTATRRFLTPGVYRWTVTTIGGLPPWPGQTATGTVTVQ